MSKSIIMIVALTAIGVMMSLTGCTGIQLKETEGASLERASIQIATMRVINESSSIDKHEVIERVERARTILDGDKMISLSSLADQVVTTSEWQALNPADQSYLALLFNQIESNSVGVDHVLSEEDRQSIATLLDWIETAARFAVDDAD